MLFSGARTTPFPASATALVADARTRRPRPRRRLEVKYEAKEGAKRRRALRGFSEGSSGVEDVDGGACETEKAAIDAPRSELELRERERERGAYLSVVGYIVGGGKSGSHGNLGVMALSLSSYRLTLTSTLVVGNNDMSYAEFDAVLMVADS